MNFIFSIVGSSIQNIRQVAHTTHLMAPQMTQIQRFWSFEYVPFLLSFLAVYFDCTNQRFRIMGSWTNKWFRSWGRGTRSYQINARVWLAEIRVEDHENIPAKEKFCQGSISLPPFVQLSCLLLFHVLFLLFPWLPSVFLVFIHG